MADEFQFDEDKDADDDDVELPYGGRNGLIFLVDCTEPMFVKKGEDSPFHLTIQCLENVFKNKIFSSEHDLLGLVFFGTETEKNDNNFKHIFVFQDLIQPGAKEVIQLEDLIDEDKEKFDKRYGHNLNFSLNDALWECSFMFSKSKLSLSSKRILLFTNTDNPHENNVPLQQQAKQRARDLFENGIEIDVITLPSVGDAVFDMQKFYQDMVFLPDDEESAQYNPSEKYEELMARIKTKDHKKRAVCRITLTLPGNLSLAVSVFNLIRSQKKPTPIRLSKDQNEELRTECKTYLKDTGTIVLPTDMQMSQNYGGRKIYFDPDEVNQIKRFAEPGFTLLGFKPSATLKMAYYVKPGHFIYPDESRIRGSICLFAALLKKCQDRGVMAICNYIARKNTAPRIVALLPQEEVIGDNGIQEAPPGFHVIYLPYEEDFRELKFPEDFKKASETQIERAKDVIKKLQFSFKSENFENPVLQTHWRNVEALALDLEEAEPIADYTIPDHEAIEKRAGKLIEAFQSSMASEGYDMSAAGGSSVRGPGRRPSANSEEVSDADIKKAARLGKLEKYTLDVLKSYCNKVGIKISGKKKAALIEEIEDLLQGDL